MSWGEAHEYESKDKTGTDDTETAPRTKDVKSLKNKCCFPLLMMMHHQQ